MKEGYVYINGVKTKMMFKEHVCRFCKSKVKYKRGESLCGSGDCCWDYYPECPIHGRISMEDVLFV